MATCDNCHYLSNLNDGLLTNLAERDATIERLKREIAERDELLRQWIARPIRRNDLWDRTTGLLDKKKGGE